MARIKCPCCGNYPFENYELARFDICPICCWEYEETSHDKPDKPSGGANSLLTLNVARKNYQLFGACCYEMKKFTRMPFIEELPENNT